MPTYQLNPVLHLFADTVDGHPAVCAELTTSQPPLLIDDARLAWGLTALPAEFDEAAALHAWSTEPAVAQVAAELWRFCRDRELVVPVPGAGTVRRSSYHVATRDHPFLDMATGYEALYADNGLMRQYSDEADHPSVYLDLEHDLLVPLEDAPDLEEPQLRSDPRQQLALLFSGTFGQRRHLAPYRDDEYGYVQVELIFKSIPSGGSKHPTEALVAVERSQFVQPGLYHYSVRGNALARIAADAAPVTRRLAELSGLPAPGGDAPLERMWVLYASVVHRAMWRCRDPRSFRALLVDVGHAEGQLAALADYAGWRYRGVRAGDLSGLAGHCGLDDEQTPILAVGVLER